MFNTLATKQQQKLRLFISGPSGSGKTYSALKLASHLGVKPKIGLIDTEFGSASLYADEFAFRPEALKEYSIDNYIKKIEGAGAAGCDVLIIDSLSHAWYWLNEWVAQECARMKTENTLQGWNKAKPLEQRLIKAMLESPCHIIATARVHTEWDMQKNGGSTKVTKLGLRPEQRKNIESEFTIHLEMDMAHNAIVGKTRCKLIDGKIYNNPGKELATTILDWLNAGAPAPEPAEELDALIEAAFESTPGDPPAAFDEADGMATLLDFCKTNEIPSDYLATYLKKKHKDKLDEASFSQSLNDLDTASTALQAAKQVDPPVDLNEVLKSTFRSLCK